MVDDRLNSAIILTADHSSPEEEKIIISQCEIIGLVQESRDLRRARIVSSHPERGLHGLGYQREGFFGTRDIPDRTSILGVRQHWNSLWQVHSASSRDDDSGEVQRCRSGTPSYGDLSNRGPACV